MRMKEREMYKPVMEYLKEDFEHRFGNCHLEITANGVFSNLLKKLVTHDIIFTFLGKRASPDLTGFIHSHGKDLVIKYDRTVIQDLITVEIKPRKINLQDIYQAKMYGDLFQAKYALLISYGAIPVEIQRLDSKTSVTHRFTGDWVVYIGELYIDDHGEMLITNWYPYSPFLA